MYVVKYIYIKIYKYMKISFKYNNMDIMASTILKYSYVSLTIAVY